jgi:hypothetical protein
MAGGFAVKSPPPPLKFDAIGVKLQTPLGGSFEGCVTFFCLLVTSFELVGIVFPLASEFLWLKTCELPLKLCELLLNLSELPYQCIEGMLFHAAPPLNVQTERFHEAACSRVSSYLRISSV